MGTNTCAWILVVYTISVTLFKTKSVYKREGYGYINIEHQTNLCDVMVFLENICYEKQETKSVHIC